MMNEMSMKDLCSTCIHTPDCARRKHQTEPIWFCEEFESLPGAPKDKTENKSPDIEEESYDTLKGLCCSCKNRDTCTLKKLNGGVWHCEEFC